MDIIEVDPSDEEIVRRLVDVANVVRATDSPFMHRSTVRERQGELLYGWDLEPAIAYLVSVDGTDVAVGEYSVSEYDNRHLAWFDVKVDPDHRRRGHGSALLAFLLDRARSEGRTSVGINGWEGSAPAAFAAHHGFEQKAIEVARRQHLGDLDRDEIERLFEETRPRAAAYELLRQAGLTPEDQLEATAVMVSAINDAPTDDLDVEDEVFTVERVRAYDAAQQAKGNLIHIVVARHLETGALCGETTIAVHPDRAQIAHQHDTSVVRAHRGHRLGLLLKLDMLRWLHETQPQIASIDTWNAESNDHMIGVNEVLHYRVLGRTFAYQRST